MARWRCPRCDREFARTRQSHTCLPGNSLDATFRGRPPEQRAICDAVLRALKPLGRVHADAVRVGVFLKSDRKLAELRPKTKWLACTLYLDRTIDDPRIARVMHWSSATYVNEIKLRTVADVDDQFVAWLTEAYDRATG